MRKNSKNLEKREIRLVDTIENMVSIIGELDKYFGMEKTILTNDTVDPRTDKKARAFCFDGDYRVIAKTLNNYYKYILIPDYEEYGTEESLAWVKEEFPELDIYDEDDDIIALLTTPEKVIDFYEKKYNKLVKYVDHLKYIYLDSEHED